jgi:hypothetical protein
MFRTLLQFILRDSVVYYTSYIRMVLIKIYKLGRQNVVNCVEFVVITPAIDLRYSLKYIS